MKRSTRGLAVFALFAAAAMAMPFTYQNLASGDSALKGVSGTATLTVGGAAITPPDTTFFIDFFPFADGSNTLLVGDSTSPTRFSQMYSFTYEVLNNQAVSSVGIVLQGILGGSGFIAYSESIFALDGLGGETLIGTLSSNITTGGSSNPNGTLTQTGATYTYTENVNLSQAVTHYKVKKSFFLAVDPTDFNFARDYAGISLIEQAHVVPEPASIGAVVLGLGALAARRRRKNN